MFFIARATEPTLQPRRGRTRTMRMRDCMAHWYSRRVRGAIEGRPPEPLVAVSLDVGGTLIEVREPVGETYARHARRLGFAVSAAAMDEGFRDAFAAAPALAASVTAGARDRLAFERRWWRAVVALALRHALGGRDAPAADVERLFDGLFEYFARGDAWRVHVDAVPALEALRARGVRLGALSNFDGRLHSLLAELGLARLLDAAVASSEAGAAKPDRGAFAAIARALGDPPAARCLHVGDHLVEDVRGALDAGWRAAWIVRGAASGDSVPRGAVRVASLLEVVALVEAASA
jgi:putative hydrolase of the HAD superfamily